MIDANEMWQVEIDGQIFDARFEELTQWVTDGNLLRHHKVRRGSLRWLEAGKTPPLVPFFVAQEVNAPSPPQVAVSFPGVPPSNGKSIDPNLPSPDYSIKPRQKNASATKVEVERRKTVGAHDADELEIPKFCAIHESQPAVFICSACQNGLCSECPTQYSSGVNICPLCGAMCETASEVEAKRQEAAEFLEEMEKGFGIEDLFRAFSRPFAFPVSLFVGGLIYGAISIGQNALGFGDLYLAASALICLVIGNAFLFSVLSNTIENTLIGKCNANFFPGFEDFSLLDNVLRPFFLSLGAFFVSFGPLIVLVVASVFYLISKTAPEELQVPLQAKAEIANTSATSEFDENGLPNLEQPSNSTREEEQIRKVQELINKSRQSQLESVVGKSPEASAAERQELIRKFVKSSVAILIFAGLFFLWGLFYFPAACLVAGYTQSFGATINPFVGLDTIRCLGFNYFKVLVAVIFCVIVTAIVGGILAVVLKAFEMPMVGNLPATFLTSFLKFYFWTAFSFLLGLLLYKNADRLDLARG